MLLKLGMRGVGKYSSPLKILPWTARGPTTRSSKLGRAEGELVTSVI